MTEIEAECRWQWAAAGGWAYFPPSAGDLVTIGAMCGVGFFLLDTIVRMSKSGDGVRLSAPGPGDGWVTRR